MGAFSFAITAAEMDLLKQIEMDLLQLDFFAVKPLSSSRLTSERAEGGAGNGSGASAG